MPEIELKLALPAKDLSKAPRILATGRGRHHAAQRKLTSTYYDTQGLDLRRRDLTLRVRREGRSFVQTVKAENLTGQDLRLRYSIDFLCSLYDEDEVGRYLRRLKRLQDEFGDGNDVRVAQRRLTTLGHQPQESYRAAGFVLGWHSERIAEKERALLRRFRRFTRVDPFW